MLFEVLLSQTLQEKEISGTRVDTRDPGSAESLGKEDDAPSANELSREGGGATTGFREHGRGDPPPPRTTRVHPLFQKIRINASQLTTTLQNSSPNITSTGSHIFVHSSNDILNTVFTTFNSFAFIDRDYNASFRIPMHRSCIDLTMNSEQPRGTRRPRSRYYVPTTDHAKKPHGSPDHPPTAPSIHQSGDRASIIIQGPYNDVGRDQYITNVGREL